MRKLKYFTGFVLSNSSFQLLISMNNGPYQVCDGNTPECACRKSCFPKAVAKVYPCDCEAAPPPQPPPPPPPGKKTEVKRKLEKFNFFMPEAYVFVVDKKAAVV